MRENHKDFGARGRLLQINRSMSAIDRGDIDTGDRIDELLQRQREADQFWELSVDLLVVADYEGRLLRVSPSWLTLTGKVETALLSGDYTEITHPDDVERSMAAVARMREDHLPTRFENRILGQDGSWQTIAWSLSPVPGGERFTAIGRNLTHEREAEACGATAALALRRSTPTRRNNGPCSIPL